LVRLFLVSWYMAQDQRPDEYTDWWHMGTVVGLEIGRRGLSPEWVAFMAEADAHNVATILVAFQQEQAQERRQRVQ
jgi:hypothetical protein